MLLVDTCNTWGEQLRQLAVSHRIHAAHAARHELAGHHVGRHAAMPHVVHGGIPQAQLSWQRLCSAAPQWLLSDCYGSLLGF